MRCPCLLPLSGTETGIVAMFLQETPAAQMGEERADKVANDKADAQANDEDVHSRTLAYERPLGAR